MIEKTKAFSMNDQLVERSDTMPIFEFVCKKCHKQFETLLYSQEKPSCPSCKSFDLTKLISLVSLGSGTGSSGKSSCSSCSSGNCAHCS